MSTTDKPRTRSSARADTADTDLELVVNPEFIHAVPSLAGYVILGRTTHVRLLGASTNVELRVNKDGVPRSVEGKDAQDVRAYFEGVTSAAADRVTALHAASALATPKVTTGAFDVLESLEGEDGPEYTPVYGSRRSARKAAQSARLDAEEAVNLREAARHHTLAALSKCMQAWQQEAARTREAAEALEREAEAELLRKRLLTVFKDDRANRALMRRATTVCLQRAFDEWATCDMLPLEDPSSDEDSEDEEPPPPLGPAGAKGSAWQRSLGAGSRKPRTKPRPGPSPSRTRAPSPTEYEAVIASSKPPPQQAPSKVRVPGGHEPLSFNAKGVQQSRTAATAKGSKPTGEPKPTRNYASLGTPINQPREGTSLLMHLLANGLESLEHRLMEAGFTTTTSLGLATAAEVIVEIGPVAAWQRRGLDKVTAPPTVEYADKDAADDAMAKATGRSSAAKKGRASETAADEMALANSVLQGVPPELRAGVAVTWLGVLGSALEARDARFSGMYNCTVLDEAVENLQVLLEMAIEADIASLDDLTPVAAGAIASRLHVKRVAGLIRTQAPAATDADASVETDGATHSESDSIKALSHIARNAWGRNDNLTNAKAQGQKRLQTVVSSPTLSAALRRLDNAVQKTPSELTLDDFATECRKHPEIAELLKHSNVSMPSGATGLIEEVWEGTSRIQRALLVLAAHEVAEKLPKGADAETLCEAALYGTIGELDLSKLCRPKAQKAIFGDAPKKDSKADTKGDADDLADPRDQLNIMLPAIEKALSLLSPHDHTIHDTMLTVRSALGTAVGEGHEFREAMQGVLASFFHRLSQEMTYFRDGLRLPLMSNVWKAISDSPEIRALTNETAGSGGSKEVTRLGETVTKLTERLEKSDKLLAELKKTLNSRIDEVTQTAKRRWNIINSDGSSDHSAEGGSPSKGKGGRGRGGPSHRPPQHPPPATAPPPVE